MAGQLRIPILIPSIAAALLFAAPARSAGVEVPYWASLRADEVNMRVGPAEDYKIAWVYHRKRLPVRVLRLKEGWRLVEDPDGGKGWILARFLTRERGGIVKGDIPADMRENGEAGARLLWRLEPGVTGKLGDCVRGWCQIDIDGRLGFVEAERLWGAGEP
jgi:SH3-like domain-containing protein